MSEHDTMTDLLIEIIERTTDAICHLVNVEVAYQQVAGYRAKAESRVESIEHNLNRNLAHRLAEARVRLIEILKSGEPIGEKRSEWLNNFLFEQGAVVKEFERVHPGWEKKPFIPRTVTTVKLDEDFLLVEVEKLGLCTQFVLSKKLGIRQSRLSKDLAVLKRAYLIRVTKKQPSFLDYPEEIISLHEKAIGYFKKYLPELEKPRLYKYDIANNDVYEHHLLLNHIAYALGCFTVKKLSYGRGGRKEISRATRKGEELWPDLWGSWDRRNTYVEVENSFTTADIYEKLLKYIDSDISRVSIVCKHHGEADRYCSSNKIRLEEYHSEEMSRTDISFYGLKIDYHYYEVRKGKGAGKKQKRKKDGISVMRSGEIVAGIKR